MEEFDFHGLNVEEATSRIQVIFFQAREDGWSQVKIIVGKGPQGSLGYVIKEACENEGYDFEYEDNNEGSIIIFFD